MPLLASAALSSDERRVLDRFVARASRELGVRAVWLYGSRARGERTHPDSDVDLLVIAADRRRDRARVSRILYESAVEEGASPAFFVSMTWDREWLTHRHQIDSFFLREVERDKIVLYEQP